MQILLTIGIGRKLAQKACLLIASNRGYCALYLSEPVQIRIYSDRQRSSAATRILAVLWKTIQ